MSIEDELKRELNFLPEIEQLIQNNLHLVIEAGFTVLKVKKATMQQDTEEATDFVSYGGLTFPVRIRKPKYYDKYFGQITIRWRSAGGQKTEIDKLAEGHGDIYFYGWTKNDEVEYLCDWCLIDLVKLRDRHHLSRNNHFLRARASLNHDKKTAFTYYHVQQIKDCLIAGSDKLMKKAKRSQRLPMLPNGKEQLLFKNH